MKIIYDHPDALDHIPSSPKHIFIKQESPEMTPSSSFDNVNYIPIKQESPEMTSYQETPDYYYQESPYHDVNYRPPFENIKYYSNSFVSPLTEASNETDIASPFSPSLDSPYAILDIPCINTMIIFTQHRFLMNISIQTCCAYKYLPSIMYLFFFFFL
jgi:hypothetical protein